MRDALVIIPISKPNYHIGFSAPMAWMFSGLNVRGIYSHMISLNDIMSYEYFIIELNWVTELYEVLMLCQLIKKTNSTAKILIGGLFSILHYDTLIKNGFADYFIKGFNEKPIRLFLEGEDPKRIPNFTGTDFDNPISYVFTQEDWKDVDFDLSWNETYMSYLNDKVSVPSIGLDASGFILPMIITSRAGCSCSHSGCDYCLGSKDMSRYYNSKQLVVSNDDLISLIKKTENKGFKDISLYILSDVDKYDFSKEKFNMNAVIEVDSRIQNPESLKKIGEAFNYSSMGLSIYSEGIMGRSVYGMPLLESIISLNKENHNYNFITYTDIGDEYKKLLGKSLHMALDTVFKPEFAQYDNYIDFGKALKLSRELWEGTGNNKKFAIPKNLTSYLEG